MADTFNRAVTSFRNLMVVVILLLIIGLPLLFERLTSDANVRVVSWMRQIFRRAVHNVRIQFLREYTYHTRMYITYLCVYLHTYMLIVEIGRALFWCLNSIRTRGEYQVDFPALRSSSGWQNLEHNLSLQILWKSGKHWDILAGKLL